MTAPFLLPIILHTKTANTKDNIMKREHFLITSTNGHNVIKFKWNSANREVESLIGEVAKSEGINYHLVDSKSVKEGAYHVKGSRTWKSTDGKVVVFTIEKVA